MLSLQRCPAISDQNQRIVRDARIQNHFRNASNPIHIYVYFMYIYMYINRAVLSATHYVYPMKKEEKTGRKISWN